MRAPHNTYEERTAFTHRITNRHHGKPITPNAQMSTEFTVLKTAPDAILIIDRSDTIVFANHLANAMFGYAKLADESVNALIPTSTQNTHTTKQTKYTATPHPRPMGFGELAAHRQNSIEFPTEISLAPLEHRTDVLTIVAVRDVTQRKVVELQLQTAQRMEAIDRLANNVTHDFNNLLTVILSYASLDLDGLKRTDPVRKDVEEIHHATKRANALVKQLLTFGRQQILQPRHTNLHKLIDNMKKLIRRLMNNHIVITLLEPNAIGTMSIDPIQIEQVLMNLAVNTRNAMPTGGHLTIETANAELDTTYTTTHARVRPDSYVILTITNTDIDIDETIRTHLFKPFFTTKKQGRGTNLKLATVFGIVQQNSDHIWMYNKPNRDTTFKLYFPHMKTPTEMPAAPKTVETRDGTKTVLLMEDDAAIHKLITTILRHTNYNILKTQNNNKTLVISKHYKTTIHLLLTDIVIPHISNHELAQRIAPAHPTMKMLFISGYTHNAIVHHDVLDTGIAFLPKPTTPKTLLTKMRTALDV